MYATTVENLPVITLLVILAGSMLGSMVIFVTGRGSRFDQPDAKGAEYGYARPADWPRRQQGVRVDQTTGMASDRPGGRRPSFVTILMVAALAIGVMMTGLFAYRSPWPLETDLRHLSATLHCDLADRVGLAPAAMGEPGYHLRNDRDRNGVSCETYGPAIAVGQTPSGQADKLSLMPLDWPAPAGGTPDTARN